MAEQSTERDSTRGGARRRVPARLWVPAALVALAAGGYFGLWREVLRDRVFPKNWGVVEPGHIYRSGLMMPNLVKRTLAAHHIRVIVSLYGRDTSDPRQKAEEQAAGELGIELLRFPMKGNGLPGDKDAEAGQRKYASAVAAVVKARKEGRPVLVQCAAGAQRTGGVVAVYQLLFGGARPADVLAEMRRHGWDDRKHRVLSDYLNANLPAIARCLAEMKVLDRVPDPVPRLTP